MRMIGKSINQLIAMYVRGEINYKTLLKIVKRLDPEYTEKDLLEDMKMMGVEPVGFWDDERYTILKYITIAVFVTLALILFLTLVPMVPPPP